jgi:uncharacterized protein
MATHTVPARTGRAVPLPKGHTIRITNTHGSQVVDFWAFTHSDQQLTTFLSLPHTRASTLHLWPQVSDILTTNHREPILEFTADTSPGIHDTLIAACDEARYLGLGFGVGEHASCAQNLRAGLAELGIPWPTQSPLLKHWTPAPFNLFMNIPIGEGNSLSFEPAVSKPGDYVELKALVATVVVMSCCPQDSNRVPINGKDCVPRGVEYMVIAP